jgi:hypothetical protein
MSADPKPLRYVTLVTAEGAALVHFGTDRDTFSPLATYDRDRVFVLASTAGDSVVYVEVLPWRISGRTIDAPKERKRRRKTATIIKFPARRNGGAA